MIGAGVIGSLFAGHLAQVADVCVLTRRREHADALNARGPARDRSQRRARPRHRVRRPRLAARRFDVGIVATKATGLEEAAAALEGRFPEATIVTTLNGLGAEEVVRAHGRLADRLRCHVHERHQALRHRGRVRARHRDVARAVRGDPVRAGGGDRRPDQRAQGSRRGRSPTCGRPSGRSSSSTRPSTRSLRSPGSRTTTTSPTRRHRPISGTSSTISSTRARRSPRRPASSSTTTRGR